MRRLLAAMALAPALALAACTPSRATPPDEEAANATIVHVVDGDTVVVRVRGQEMTARLIGIDTPETVDPKEPVGCYGPEASARTTALLPAGTAVRLERDVEGRDRYDRLLVYVFRAGVGLFVNRALAEEGLARPLWIEPNGAYRGEIDAAVAAARAQRRGLWGACQ